MCVLDAENININIIFHIHRDFLEFLGLINSWLWVNFYFYKFVCGQQMNSFDD